MATLIDLKTFIEQNPDLCEPGNPASDDLIDAAERFLQLRFPSDYREFLRRWGSLAIGPLEYYGITGKNFESSCVPNAIWYTHILRTREALPAGYVILYNNNGDEYLCLDTSQIDKSPVIVWDACTRKSLGVRAESLFDFILNEVADLDLD